MKLSKYKNKKTIIDGVEFDSKREAKRYTELLLLQQREIIMELNLQVKFELLPQIKTDIQTFPATYYIADFTYFDTTTNEWVIEDVKGFPNDTYPLKKKMLLNRYSHWVFFENGNKQKYYRKKY